MGYLLPEVTDDLHATVLVHRGLVHNVLDSVSIAEGIEGLCVVQMGRGNGYERKMDGDDLSLQSLTPMRNQYTGQSCRITLTILC